MKGTAAKEFPLLTLDFTPEGGKTYDLKLVSDGSEGWLLVPFEAE